MTSLSTFIISIFVEDNKTQKVKDELSRHVTAVMKFLLSSLEVKSISLRFLINSFYFLILSHTEIEFELEKPFLWEKSQSYGSYGKRIKPKENFFLLSTCKHKEAFSTLVESLVQMTCIDITFFEIGRVYKRVFQQKCCVLTNFSSLSLQCTCINH